VIFCRVIGWLVPLFGSDTAHNEIRRLFAELIANSTNPISHWLAWSQWRRRHQARARTSRCRYPGGRHGVSHQARARTSHYRRRGHRLHQQPST
jgi:hypothetical protein